jgi:hypothetical protein
LVTSEREREKKKKQKKKRMVTVKEEGQVERFRVFNWNQRLRKFGGEPSDLSNTQGLFFFLITENFTI